MRWGVVGVGAIAGQAVEAIRTAGPSTTIEAVAAKRRSNAAAFGETNRIPHVADSAETLFRSGLVDIVYLATPPATHTTLISEAMLNGLHVVCEKPIVSGPQDVLPLTAAPPFFFEASVYPHHSQTVALDAVVDGGMIGEVQRVEVRLHYFADRVDNHRFDRASGGGAMLDIGCYCLHAVRRLGGEPVSAEAEVEHDDSGVDLASRVELELASGASAHIDVSLGDPPSQSMRVIGTTGVINVVEPFRSIEAAPMEVVLTDGTSTRLPSGLLDGFARQFSVAEAAFAAPADASSWTAQALQQADALKLVMASLEA